MGRRSLTDRLTGTPVLRRLDRRAFLRGAGGAAAVGCAGSSRKGRESGTQPETGEPWIDPAGSCGPGTPTAGGDPSAAGACPFPADPFGLGVASGDPLHDRVVLWTRLVVDPTDVAASPDDAADVVWELAADPDFESILQEGLVVARAEGAHAVHVDVDGLESETEYWFRFRCGSFESPVGRARTLPCPDALPEVVRLGFATCQNWLSGFYASHRSLAEAQLDLVVFLGDYIYEAGDVGAVRDHGAPECTDLEGYRNRHGLYRSDPDLQAAHASAPWVAIWDDHEVDNNAAGAATDDAAFAERRRVAYQAWYEHMPVRQAPAEDGGLRIHRHLDLGTLARLVLLDGRQHRDLQPCDDVIGSACDEVSEDRTLLGAEQEAWLETTLAGQSADWVLVANPVVMLPIDLGGVFLNPDQWDGYPTARARFLESVAAHASGRTVLFTGDIHAAGAGVVPAAPADYESAPAIAELVVPPTSSRVTLELAGSVGPLLATQAHIEWWDWTVNGWTEAVVRPEGIEAIYWLVDDVTDPASEVRAARRWQVTPGALRPVDLDA